MQHEPPHCCNSVMDFWEARLDPSRLRIVPNKRSDLSAILGTRSTEREDHGQKEQLNQSTKNTGVEMFSAFLPEARWSFTPGLTRM